MTHAVNPALYAKLPYRPIEDFEPISQFGKLSFVILVRADSPLKTLNDLTALLKAEPGKHNFGAGSLPARVASELYLQQAGVTAASIGYKSNPQAFPDLLSGQLTFMTIDTTNGRLQIDGGKMRGLAVSLPTRDNLIPKIPSAVEVGLPGFQIWTWTGFYAPKGTPKDIVQKINQDIVSACNDPQVLKQFESLGGAPTTSTPEEFGSFTASEIQRWSKIIKSANISLD
jgi:tripartite-type tricarboxylate transporter receptor subunit TctC